MATVKTIYKDVASSLNELGWINCNGNKMQFPE